MTLGLVRVLGGGVAATPGVEEVRMCSAVFNSIIPEIKAIHTVL